MRGCNCTIQLLPNSIAIAVMLNAKPLRDIGRYSKEALLPSKVMRTYGMRCSDFVAQCSCAGPTICYKKCVAKDIACEWCNALWYMHMDPFPRCSVVILHLQCHGCEMSWKLPPWFCYTITFHTLQKVNSEHHYMVVMFVAIVSQEGSDVCGNCQSGR